MPQDAELENSRTLKIIFLIGYSDRSRLKAKNPTLSSAVNLEEHPGSVSFTPSELTEEQQCAWRNARWEKGRSVSGCF